MAVIPGGDEYVNAPTDPNLRYKRVRDTLKELQSDVDVAFETDLLGGALGLGSESSNYQELRPYESELLDRGTVMRPPQRRKAAVINERDRLLREGQMRVLAQHGLFVGGTTSPVPPVVGGTNRTEYLPDRLLYAGLKKVPCEQLRWFRGRLYGDLGLGSLIRRIDSETYDETTELSRMVRYRLLSAVLNELSVRCGEAFSGTLGTVSPRPIPALRPPPPPGGFKF